MKLWKIVAIGVTDVFIWKLINNAHKVATEEERKTREDEIRKNTPCNFENGISEGQFEFIVRQSGKHIKRLTNLSVNGPIVYGTIRTNSGLSEWNFKADFNDYGRITGKYWLSSDNEDSSIPTNIAEKISCMICSFPEIFGQTKTGTEFEERVDSNIYENIKKSDTDATENINLKKAKHQSESSFSQKMNIIKKKIKAFFLKLSLFLLLFIAIFTFYKYREKQKNKEIGISSSEAIGQDYRKITKKLEKAGFINIHTNPQYDLEIKEINSENTISKIEIHRETEFTASSQYPYDTPIEVTFHTLKKINVPFSAKSARKMDYEKLELMVREAGFVNVNTQATYDLITGWIFSDGTVDKITINGEDKFSKNSSYRPDAEVIIIYHTFKKNKD